MIELTKFEDIKKAKENFPDYVKHTPLLRAEKLDELLNHKVYFKPECLQTTGSFKVRGATNKILSLTQEEKDKGIIASSSGNHGLGVALSSNMLGVQCTLVLPTNAPMTKVDGAKALGANVIQHGFGSIERYKKLYEIMDEEGQTLVHSYNDPVLIAGQGTVGYEIMLDLPDVDVVVVPLGAGGLLAGVCLAVKSMNPNVKVIGVEPEAIPRYTESFKVGHPVEVELKNTLADGLMVTKTGEYTYPLIEKYVDEIVTVSDDYIQEALTHTIFKGKLLVEPSAVIGIAASLSNIIKFAPKTKVCYVLTGGNIDAEVLIDLVK